MKYIIVCFQSVGIWSGWKNHESHGLDKWRLGWLLLAVGKITWHLTLGMKLSYSEILGHTKLVGDGTDGMMYSRKKDSNRIDRYLECSQHFLSTYINNK